MYIDEVFICIRFSLGINTQCLALFFRMLSRLCLKTLSIRPSVGIRTLRTSSVDVSVTICDLLCRVSVEVTQYQVSLASGWSTYDVVVG